MEFTDYLLLPFYWLIIGGIPAIVIGTLMFAWLKKDVKEIPTYQMIIFVMIVGAVIDLLGLI